MVLIGTRRQTANRRPTVRLQLSHACHAVHASHLGGGALTHGITPRLTTNPRANTVLHWI